VFGNQTQRARQIDDEAHLLLSALSTSAELTQTVSNIRVQRFILFLTLASTVIRRDRHCRSAKRWLALKVRPSNYGQMHRSNETEPRTHIQRAGAPNGTSVYDSMAP
jgi:hypothetical protein